VDSSSGLNEEKSRVVWVWVLVLVNDGWVMEVVDNEWCLVVVVVVVVVVARIGASRRVVVVVKEREEALCRRRRRRDDSMTAMMVPPDLGWVISILVGYLCLFCCLR